MVFYLDASQGGTKGRKGKNSPEPRAVLTENSMILANNVRLIKKEMEML